MTTRICCGRTWEPRSYVSHTSHHTLPDPLPTLPTLPEAPSLPLWGA